LLFEIWHRDIDSHLVDFRKEELEKGLRNSPTKSESQLILRVHYFALKERIPTYTRVGNIDSTNNVKIFFEVDESFEKK